MSNNSTREELKLITIAEIPYRWIRNELEFDGEIRRGDRGKKVKIIQEWLSLQGYQVRIDHKFGPASEQALRQFQTTNRLGATGFVDENSFSTLVEPMLRALTPRDTGTTAYNDRVIEVAQQHLAEQPREVGGQNCGPWVRLYMRGKEGRAWPWCAGFVCFILRQTADAMNAPIPFEYTRSCDILATQGKATGMFVSQRQLERANPALDEMPPGSIFLNRRTSIDWTHTGLVTAFHVDTFESIEGNTNDDGDREGYEVCKRFRGYDNIDFIRIV